MNQDEEAARRALPLEPVAAVTYAQAREYAATVAAALEKVGGVKVKFGLAMPIFLRKLLLKDLHYMFIYFEDHKGPKGEPEDFKKVLPDAFNAEDWFRFHGAYSNGERI